MRLTYTVCILLATTICCIAVEDAVVAKGDNKTITQQTPDTTTAVLSKNSSNPATVAVSEAPVPANAPTTVFNSSVTAKNSTDNIVSNKTASNAINVPATNNNISTSKPSDTPTTPTKPDATTTHPDTSAPSTTTKNVTAAPTATTTTTTTTTTTSTTTPKAPTMSTTSSSPSTIAPPPATTTVSVSTKEAPPSPHKERHFDGLSFLGGIILATSLMAIGVLSWKFYRTFNERNYRTL